MQVPAFVYTPSNILIYFVHYMTYCPDLQAHVGKYLHKKDALHGHLFCLFFFLYSQGAHQRLALFPF